MAAIRVDAVRRYRPHDVARRAVGGVARGSPVLGIPAGRGAPGDRYRGAHRGRDGRRDARAPGRPGGWFSRRGRCTRPRHRPGRGRGRQHDGVGRGEQAASPDARDATAQGRRRRRLADLRRCPRARDLVPGAQLRGGPVPRPVEGAARVGDRAHPRLHPATPSVVGGRGETAAVAARVPRRVRGSPRRALGARRAAERRPGEGGDHGQRRIPRWRCSAPAATEAS